MGLLRAGELAKQISQEKVSASLLRNPGNDYSMKPRQKVLKAR